MKIHVIREDQTAIENYQKVVISPNQIDLSSIADNECKFILANDVLDSFSVENIPSLLQALAKKMRLGSKLVIGGTDIRLFCKNVIIGMINEGDAAKVVANVQSMLTPNQVEAVIRQLNLDIDTTQISGIHYEITASRGT